MIKTTYTSDQRPLTALWLSLLLFCLTITSVSAQRQKLFRAIVTLADSSKLDGILYEVTDSTLSLAPNTPEAIALLQADSLPPLRTVPYADVRRVTLRRKGHGWRGPLTGFGVGLVTGGLGYINSRGLNDGLGRDLVGAFALIVLPVNGVLIGSIAGLVPRRSIGIRQNRARFRSVRAELRPFSVRAQRLAVVFSPAVTRP